MNKLLTPLDHLDTLFDHLRTRRGGDTPLALLLLAPAATILTLFTLAPLIAALIMSLYGGKYGLGGYIALANYHQALTSPAFWRSLAVTTYYALGVVPLTLLLSFTIAYALYQITLARGLLRTLFFLPYVTSAVAAAMVWRAMLNPQTGVLNTALTNIGLPPQQWLLEPRGILHLLTAGAIPPDIGPSLALCCVIAFDIWHGAGFAIVIFLAGLSALPRELLDAARVDGATTWHQIRHIVLPLLSPTILFLTTVGLIKAFQAFNSFYALTQGSRALGTTENLIMHIYANFYEYGYWGYGAATATLLSTAILLTTLLQWRIANRHVHYE